MYDIYIVNDEQPLQEDGGVEDERDVVGLAPSGKSVGIIGTENASRNIPNTVCGLVGTFLMGGFLNPPNT